MGRVHKPRPVLKCHNCGNPILASRKRHRNAGRGYNVYCSVLCMVEGQFGDTIIREPTSDSDIKTFYDTLETRKRELREGDGELATIVSLTPPDDSPEAERLLRERVCPNPKGLQEERMGACHIVSYRKFLSRRTKEGNDA